ncbi:hypothetical protein [Sandaracinus amylolyticus]|uniref:hypothetical protein n=1 Tax=Sandaracinus amylolyticus TaxID=927083 RepID=UPI001F47C0CB|nr:hypothetical protein [Sandaracinus amylolyticus]UJR79853.1 Hypothetical protein I5071_18920 [Sandaracinus amylolyticus]
MRIKILDTVSINSFVLWPSRVVTVSPSQAQGLIAKGVAEQTTDALTIGTRAGRPDAAFDRSILSRESANGWPFGEPSDGEAMLAALVEQDAQRRGPRP